MENQKVFTISLKGLSVNELKNVEKKLREYMRQLPTKKCACVCIGSEDVNGDMNSYHT